MIKSNEWGNDAMKVLHENLLVQFSIVSFIILAAIAVLLVNILASKIRSDAVDNLVEEAVGASSGRLLNAITPADLETPMMGDRYDRFHEFVQRSIVSDRTARIKLWAKDGTVIYSNDKAGVGEKFPTKELLMKALDGQNAIEIKVPDAAENERERFLGTLMEVYTPIVFPGSAQPDGALEIYQFYQPTAERIATLQNWVFMSVGGGFLALYGGLVFIVWGGWNTIVRQRGQLELVNRQLETKVQELGDTNARLMTEMAESKHLGEQLLHVQKMESIGRLAGGVAHDFNNLLTPIMGYAQLGAMETPNGHKVHTHLEEIKKAAERAATLTSQLLAFSRRQVVDPRVINLNDLIADMDNLLRRLIGEDIELVTTLDPGLGLVKADPGQVEQVVMNLVVNARDAISHDGVITIKTSNIEITQAHLQQDPQASLGPHIMLSVSDSGPGMTAEVKARIFEPFFTTKEEGKGTGLGLATCYGIVQQSGGHIEVITEVGLGTTFNIYLPRVEEAASEKVEIDTDTELRRGCETVLLVEDETAVRDLVSRLLHEQGYQVLEAGNGEEALAKLRQYPGKEIHLLLTDVVMPQMGGIELSKKFSALYPNAKVLFISGYVNEVLIQEIDNEQNVGYIQKPFLPSALMNKVRESLDSSSHKVPEAPSPVAD
jgi:signal transduction histidine kinase/ActR/RegA family two-component response regulator